MMIVGLLRNRRRAATEPEAGDAAGSPDESKSESVTS